MSTTVCSIELTKSVGLSSFVGEGTAELVLFVSLRCEFRLHGDRQAALKFPWVFELLRKHHL